MPAHDEFQEKYDLRSSSSGTIPFRPRVRRNRRTALYIVLIVIIALYYIFGNEFTARWGPLDDMGEEVDFVPWFGSGPPPEILEIAGISNGAPKLSLARLYKTLRLAPAAGLRTWNRNVLFIAGDVESAKRLIVTACDMAKNERLQIHFALMADIGITVGEFEDANGLGPDSECQILVHDATTGSKTPLGDAYEEFINAALVYMHRFLHPQVMIVDEEHESREFMKAVQGVSWKLSIPIIELPPNAAENMRWMTKLDSSSLREWKTPKVEIFVRSDKYHGNLERLLKSLRGADYFGILPSRLTIEIGGSEPLHPFTQQFLQNFGWPSRDRIGIRYNVLPPPPDPLSQAINHIQSFFPVDKDTSILFLDPNVELSPYYFHWLHYVTLEYRYSLYPFFGSHALYGVSLMLPREYLNGTQGFDPQLQDHSPFLYAAPSADAALFYPEMWINLNTYMRWRVKGILQGEKQEPPAGETNLDDPKQELLSGETKIDDMKKSPTEQKQGPILPPRSFLEGLSEQARNEKLQKENSDDEDSKEPSPTPHTLQPSPHQKRTLTPSHNFTLPHIHPSPTLTSSWLLYLTELVLLRAGTMLYPGFGATLPPDSTSPPSPDVLAILHNEIPSHFRADDIAHSGQNEPRLIPHGTLLDALPGWDLPELVRLPVRDMRGDVAGQRDLDIQAEEYKEQVMHHCLPEEKDDWAPVEGIFCDRFWS